MQNANSRRRAITVQALVPVYLVLITGVPLAAAGAVVLAPSPVAWRAAAMIVAPALCLLGYVLIAGLLARVTRSAIVPGRFPRALGHAVYGRRRLYALCWTAICYCGPLYHAVLAIPLLKRVVFRLFGYRGSLDFQTYPDTWIRDLPLLTIGKGAYLSNKATISPNMCLKNGKIIVLPVSIGAGTMIGHLTMIAPGADIGPDSEIGVGAAIGVNVCVGAHSLVGPETVLDHDSVIGERCVIGTRAYVGRKTVIRDGLRVPPGAVIPGNLVLSTQSEVEAAIANEPPPLIPPTSPRFSRIVS